MEKISARRWAQIFSVLAILLFAGTLARSLYVGWQNVRTPCGGLVGVTNSGTPVASPSVIDFAPKSVGMGSPVCLAIAGAANVAIGKDGNPALHLFINGLKLTGALGRLFDRQKNLVLFNVTRGAADAAAWSEIIGQPDFGDDGGAPGSIRVRISAGTNVEEFDRADLPPLELRIFDLWAVILGIAAFIAAVVALIFTAQVSATLRDGNAQSTYSLGRVQMAFWLYLITAGFIYIWLVTGTYNGILTSQSLTLLGISGVTGLMAIAVNGAASAASQGFWKDILSDGGGVALHRLQIVVWNAILGVVFLMEIYRSFRLPTFDSNLLILMGISGLTYVGFKFNEK